MENTKRIFDESKKNEQINCDLKLGKLMPSTLFIAHHAATSEVQEQSHRQVLKTYPNGGQDVQTVIDVPYKAAQAAWDEHEDINIFIPYTVAELATKKEQNYKMLVESKIRQRYSMNDEIAILRQSVAKPTECAEYSAYCELCKLEAKNQLSV